MWLKVEGDNPTGSFKDRGMTAAISVARHEGAEAVVCASTGNTSASMAAYAAKAGLKPLVLVPEGKIAAGKMAQAILHGAQVIMVRGNFDDCLRLAKGLAWDYPVALVNSVNPVRLEGQKTAAFEIVDFLGDAPDFHLLPVGNAGNISAYWLGYTQYADLGLATRKPVMRGFQAEGAAPLVTGEPFPDPETKATAIRIGNPASWKLAEAAAQRVRRPVRGGQRRPDPRRAARARPPRRRLRRAGLGGRRRRAARRSWRRASPTPAAPSSSPSPATASRTPRPRSRASRGGRSSSTRSSTPTSPPPPRAAGLA